MRYREFNWADLIEAIEFADRSDGDFKRIFDLKLFEISDRKLEETQKKIEEYNDKLYKAMKNNDIDNYIKCNKEVQRLQKRLVKLCDIIS